MDAVLLPLSFFGALTVAVAGGGAIPWDSEIVRYAEGHYKSSIVHPLDSFLKVSLVLGGAVVTAAVVGYLKRRQPRGALFWAIAVAGVMVVDLPLKELVRRPPLYGSGYSFPSGNAMASAALLATVALTSSSRWRGWILIVGVPLLIAYGAALVYAWWHYPSDVVAGWCFALAWVMGSWLLLRPRGGLR